MNGTIETTKKQVLSYVNPEVAKDPVLWPSATKQKAADKHWWREPSLLKPDEDEGNQVVRQDFKHSSVGERTKPRI